MLEMDITLLTMARTSINTMQENVKVNHFFYHIDRKYKTIENVVLDDGPSGHLVSDVAIGRRKSEVMVEHRT